MGKKKGVRPAPVNTSFLLLKGALSKLLGAPCVGISYKCSGDVGGKLSFKCGDAELAALSLPATAASGDEWRALGDKIAALAAEQISANVPVHTEELSPAEVEAKYKDFADAIPPPKHFSKWYVASIDKWNTSISSAAHVQRTAEVGTLRIGTVSYDATKQACSIDFFAGPQASVDEALAALTSGASLANAAAGNGGNGAAAATAGNKQQSKKQNKNASSNVSTASAGRQTGNANPNSRDTAAAIVNEAFAALLARAEADKSSHVSAKALQALLEATKHEATSDAAARLEIFKNQSYLLGALAYERKK